MNAEGIDMNIKRAFLSFLLICLIVAAVPAAVVNGLTIDITADEKAASDKAFDLYVDFDDPDGIGAVQAVLPYDREHLALKSVRLENKNNCDFFHYSDVDGQVRFVISNAAENPSHQSVKLHFSPIGNGAASYRFSLETCKVIDPNAEQLFADQLPVCTINLTGNSHELVEQESHSSKKSSSSSMVSAASRTAETSKKASGTRTQTSRVTHPKSTPESSQLTTSEVVSYRQDQIYYIHDNDNSFRMDKTFFLFFGGLLIVCALAVIYAYHAGRIRQRRKDREKKDDP